MPVLRQLLEPAAPIAYTREGYPFLFTSNWFTTSMFANTGRNSASMASLPLFLGWYIDLLQLVKHTTSMAIRFVFFSWYSEIPKGCSER